MTDRIERSGKGRRNIGLWLEGSGFELKEKRRQYDRRGAVRAEQLVEFLEKFGNEYLYDAQIGYSLTLNPIDLAKAIIDFTEKGKK